MNSAHPHFILNDVHILTSGDAKLFENHQQFDAKAKHASGASATLRTAGQIASAAPHKTLQPDHQVIPSLGQRHGGRKLLNCLKCGRDDPGFGTRLTDSVLP